MAPQLAWLGLGNMGSGMVKNIVEKGNLERPLILFNRTEKRATDLSAKLPSGKTVVASSVEDAVAKADIIFTMLGDDDSVKDTIAAALKNDVRGKLFVECSTIHPDSTEFIAKSIQDKEAEMVACPVFGAPAMADAGQLVCVPAGPAHSVRKVIPYCKGVMSRGDIDLSDQSFGKATLLKIIGNTMILNMMESLAEGHTLAETSGLGTDNLHKFVELLFPGPYTTYSGRLVSGDYYKREEPLFAASLARKDARHALDLAKAAGTTLKDLEVVDGHLADAEKYMGSNADFTGIYGAVRLEAGLRYEN